MINHALVAQIDDDNQNGFIRESLLKFESVASNVLDGSLHGRVLLLQDGYGFPWLETLPHLSKMQRCGLKRFRTETSMHADIGFIAQLAFEAPFSESKSVNAMTAKWLVAYSDSLTIVWDGSELTEEGQFVRHLIDKAMAARLVITWIDPSSQQFLLFTGKDIDEIELSRLALGYLSTDSLRANFISWCPDEWIASINDFKSLSNRIAFNEQNFKTSGWLGLIKQKLNRYIYEFNYKPQLHIFDRMAGYVEKLLFASISLDRKYWHSKKYRKTVLSSDGVWYGPFEGTYENLHNNNTVEHNLIRETTQLDLCFKLHDQHATLAANRQRSAYWWIGLFNLGAVIISLFGVGIEWVLIVMAMGMGKFASVFRWHQHWLQSRSVAETIRYNRMLLPLLATCRYQHQSHWIASNTVKDHWQAPPEWQAAEAIREQGWPMGANQSVYSPLCQLFAIKDYVIASLDSQRVYHSENHKRQKNMVKHVGWLAATLGTIATVMSMTQNFSVLKVSVVGDMITIFPALIGMLQGILAQIEANRLSLQSKASMIYLESQIKLLNSIDEDNPWRSFCLIQKIAQDSADAMINENQGWRRLLSSR
jgi:hypothetical protein